MKSPRKAFEVEVQGKVVDYRSGGPVDLQAVEGYFKKSYSVKKLWNVGRHVLGILSKDNNDFFLKLATSEGISAVTQNEYRWNGIYNELVPREMSELWVPKNIEQGWFRENLYYFITDKFTGTLLAERPEHGIPTPELSGLIPTILSFSEFIAELPVSHESDGSEHQSIFRAKVHAWYEAIPEEVRQKYGVHELLDVVEDGVGGLVCRSRHGDYTPWHIFQLMNGKFGLIDGEHFLANGVIYYDIGYFLQRVYSVLELPDIARDLFSLLIDRRYDMDSLRVILSARGIGGYLDASFAASQVYDSSQSFQQWVLDIHRK